MISTIGELTNGLMEYANIIEMSVVNNLPFIRALLGNGSSGCTKAYVYIVQTDAHRYSVCDIYDDLCGNRYFPTGSKTNPFIQERDIINLKFAINNPEKNGDYSSVVNNLNRSTFFDHLYKLMYSYDIIRIDPKIFSLPLINVFSNPRIKRNIETALSEKKCHNCTIGNFINMTIRDKDSINLVNLKQKESKEIVTGLKSIGITAVIENNTIIQASFEKRK